MSPTAGGATSTSAATRMRAVGTFRARDDKESPVHDDPRSTLRDARQLDRRRRPADVLGGNPEERARVEAPPPDLPVLRTRAPRSRLRLLPLASLCALVEPRGGLRRGLAGLGSNPFLLGDPLQEDDRVALRRAVPQREDREPADGLVVVGIGEVVQQRPDRVDRAWVLAREQLEREQRRAAAGRTAVLEATPQELLFLPEAELADGAVGRRSLAIVVGPCGGLELVGPGRAELRKIAFVPALGERVCLDPGLGEAQADASDRSAGPM